MRTLPIIFLCLICFSCEESLEIDANFEPEVYVKGIISADSIFVINVGFSREMHSTESSFIDNADIKLKNITNQKCIDLVYDGDGNYISTLTGKTDHEYSLVVDVPGFEPVYSSTYIPDNIAVKHSFESTYNAKNQLESLEINLEIENNPDILEFYSVEILSYYGPADVEEPENDPNETKEEEGDGSGVVIEGTPFEPSSPPTELPYKSLNFFSDGEFKGTPVNASIKIDSEELSNIKPTHNGNTRAGSTSPNQDPDAPLVKKFQVKIVSVSEDLYEYIKTREGSKNGSLAFNIKNGAGIFGGENIQYIDIKQ